MPSITDSELISKLAQATSERRIKWERTHTSDVFASSYAQKWTLTIGKFFEHGEIDYWIALSNAEGEEIMKIYSSNEAQLDFLFDLARRQAMQIDEAVSDILNEVDPKNTGPEITDDDIPF